MKVSQHDENADLHHVVDVLYFSKDSFLEKEKACAMKSGALGECA